MFILYTFQDSSEAFSFYLVPCPDVYESLEIAREDFQDGLYQFRLNPAKHGKGSALGVLIPAKRLSSVEVYAEDPTPLFDTPDDINYCLARSYSESERSNDDDDDDDADDEREEAVDEMSDEKSPKR